jgi:TIR domain
VDQLQEILEQAGIRVWRDTADIWPGQDWKLAICNAITTGSLVFLACFSEKSQRKGNSYQNEELNLAVGQMRLRQPGTPWLIPVRFDKCSLPSFDLGGGRMLNSLQCADLFGPNYQAQAERLVLSIQRILTG